MLRNFSGQVDCCWVSLLLRRELTLLLSRALSWSLQRWDPSRSVSVWDSRSPRLARGYRAHLDHQRYGWGSVSYLISLLLCSRGLWPYPWNQTATVFVYFPSSKTEISTLILPFRKRRTIYQEMTKTSVWAGRRVMLYKSIAALCNSRRNRPPWSLSIILSDHSGLVNTEKVLKRDSLRVVKKTQTRVWKFGVWLW